MQIFPFAFSTHLHTIPGVECMQVCAKIKVRIWHQSILPIDWKKLGHCGAEFIRKWFDLYALISIQICKIGKGLTKQMNMIRNLLRFCSAAKISIWRKECSYDLLCCTNTMPHSMRAQWMQLSPKEIVYVYAHWLNWKIRRYTIHNEKVCTNNNRQEKAKTEKGKSRCLPFSESPKC